MASPTALASAGALSTVSVLSVLTVAAARSAASSAFFCAASAPVWCSCAAFADAFAFFSLSAAFDALVTALSKYSFKSALTAFAEFVAACSALALSDAAACAAKTASSFALIAPATVLSSFKVDALIGVPSFIGSSFRIRVTISDVPSDFAIVHRPGCFATRSSKTILSISCHVFTGKRNVCFSKRFNVEQNLLNLIHR